MNNRPNQLDVLNAIELAIYLYFDGECRPVLKQRQEKNLRSINGWGVEIPEKLVFSIPQLIKNHKIFEADWPNYKVGSDENSNIVLSEFYKEVYVRSYEAVSKLDRDYPVVDAIVDKFTRMVARSFVEEMEEDKRQEVRYTFILSRSVVETSVEYAYVVRNIIFRLAVLFPGYKIVVCEHFDGDGLYFKVMYDPSGEYKTHIYGLDIDTSTHLKERVTNVINTLPYERYMVLESLVENLINKQASAILFPIIHDMENDPTNYSLSLTMLSWLIKNSIMRTVNPSSALVEDFYIRRGLDGWFVYTDPKELDYLWSDANESFSVEITYDELLSLFLDKIEGNHKNDIYLENIALNNMGRINTMYHPNGWAEPSGLRSRVYTKL